MNLSAIECYREVSINGVVVDTKLLTGEIVIENDQNRTSECTFGMYTTEQFVPITQNPRTTAVSMIGQKIVIKGGYLRAPESVRVLFKGKVVRVAVQFPDDGQPILNFECLSLSVAASAVIRNENYPVIQRETTPTKDDKGVVARSSAKGDVRSWAVVPKGGSITLYKIIKNIVLEYGIPIIDDGENQSIIVPDITFDGKNKIEFQNKESDWKFLQRLARKYNCVMTIDPDTEIFYFVIKTLTRNQSTKTMSGQNVTKDIEFYYHRYYPDKPFTMVDFSRLDPTQENAALVMQNISYSFDSTTVQGGLISNYTTPDGRPGLTVVRQEDDGKITEENYVLRQEMLNSPEADKFIKQFAMGKVTWEETKQFWKQVPVEQIEQATVRENPPVYNNPNLEFNILGCVWVVPMKKYPVYNMGFGRNPNGVDSFPLLCVGIEHRLADVFTTRVKMMVF